MMKSILVFISGTAVGAVLSFLVFLCMTGHFLNDKIILFEKEGRCISDHSFEVFEVLNSGEALASEFSREYATATGLMVLFPKKKEGSHYVGEVIEIPAGKCAKQIGVFKYPTKVGREKTVPVVEIGDK